MSYSKTYGQSLSPTKKQTQFFPAIYLKTTNSPQKGQILEPDACYSQIPYRKIDNRSNQKLKDIELERAYTIRKYLQAGVLIPGEPNKSQSRIKNSLTEQRDLLVEHRLSLSPSKQLSKIEETLNIISKQIEIYIGLLEGQKTSSEEKDYRQQKQISGKNECILELDQEQEEQESKDLESKQDQIIMISPILQTNFNNQGDEKKNGPISPVKHNVVLQVNQQNKEYKKYASQMIRMIRKAQSSIMKELDVERQEMEKNYYLKKQERQKERSDALQNAQQGIKKRQLKSMLYALKGTNKSITESPLFLNLRNKINFQGSQSTICSRKTSISKIMISPLMEKQFDDRLMRKKSMKSEICSLETSLELPISIQKLI